MERRLQGKWPLIVRYTSIAFALFHFYTAGAGSLPDMRQRAVHLVFASALIFMAFSATKRGATKATKVPIWDILFIGLVTASCVNVFVKYLAMHYNPMQATNLDLFLGIVLIILTVETGRRAISWAFPALTIVFLLYALLGHLVPGDWGYSGFPWTFIVTHLYQTGLGIWGFLTGMSATIVAIFLIFGALLLHTGAGETFMALAVRVTGRMRGGPALTAVVASSLFGTISGGSVTNVFGTGTFTIPMMKRLGYKPEFAGGVETTASTGGPLMPPIMALGAFIMAELLGISYLNVIIAGTIPAILYYIGVFASVRFESLRLNLAPVPDEEIPPWRHILTWGRLAPLVIPFVVLIGLLIKGFYLGTCAFGATVSLVVLFFFSDLSLSGMRQRAGMIVDGLERGGKTLARIAPLLVCANIIVALISQTGIGVKISGAVISVAGSSMFLALVLAAVGCIVIGMGIPVTGAYVLAAAVFSPPLVKLGLIPLVGHFFIFYFSAVSAVTPPVCVAAFAAAAIAQTSFLRVAWVGMKLGIVAYLLPFIFSYEPALLMIGGNPQEILMVTLSSLVGIVFISAGIWGYLTAKINILTRLLFFGGAFLMLMPGLTTDLWGLGIIALGLSSQMAISFVKKRLLPASKR